MKIMKTAMVAMLCSSAFVVPAYAQDAQNAAEEDNDTIIVTATRRARDVQDIPLAVTALSPDQLEKQNVVNVQDIRQVSASFSTSNAQIASGSVVLRIRGVGTTSNNIGFESAVGIFIDGAYQSRPGIALSEFVDVERVEVLRGPQGTLFGRNTSAGALNITNVRPDLDEFGGFANVTYGNFNTVGVQGAINAPLVEDTLALRLTGAYRRADGTVDVLDGDGNFIGDSNDIDQFLVRGQLGFEAGNGIRGRLIGDYSRSTSSCCVAVELLSASVENAGFFNLVGLGPRGGQAGPNVPSNPFDTATLNDALDDRIATSNFIPTAEIDQWGITGEIEIPLGDSANIFYIGSYRDFESQETFDSDFSGLDIFNIDLLNANIQTQTHELRVQGEALNDRLDWLVGVFYSNEDIFSTTASSLGSDFDALAGALFGGAAGPAPLALFSGGISPATVSNTNQFTQDSTSFSVFTHNTFALTDGLDFTFGLRYSDESKEGSFSQPVINNTLCPAILSNLTGTPPAGAPPAPPLGTALGNGLFGLGCFAFTAPADLPTTAFIPTPVTFDGTGANEFNDDELIWTVKLGYEFTVPVNVYASFTHGYKSGGFNLDSTAAIAGANPQFASEEVDAYEIGVKTKFLNNAVTLNIAGFYEEFTDFQVLEFTGAQFQTFNVPLAISKGVEIESNIRPDDNFTLSAALTYNDAEYPDDCAGDQINVPNIATLCGNSLTNAPEFVGIVGANYENDIGENLSFFLNAQLRLESDRRTSTQATEVPNAAAIAAAGGNLQAAIAASPLVAFDVQDGNAQINLRAGIGAQDKAWGLEFFVNNLTDVNTRGVSFNTVLRGTSRSAFLQNPRLYGVTLRGRF